MGTVPKSQSLLNRSHVETIRVPEPETPAGAFVISTGFGGLGFRV